MLKRTAFSVYGFLFGLINTPIILMNWVLITKSDGFKSSYETAERDSFIPLAIMECIMIGMILAGTMIWNRKDKKTLLCFLVSMCLGIGTYLIYQQMTMF